MRSPVTVGKFVDMVNLPKVSPDVEDLTLSEVDRCQLIGWAKKCVIRLLPIFEQHRPGDDRLKTALDEIEQFQLGRLRPYVYPAGW
ncbi:MAG: putative immunity protein [Canibacter sp.]